jgi:hypothetical protein
MPPRAILDAGTQKVMTKRAPRPAERAWRTIAKPMPARALRE